MNSSNRYDYIIAGAGASGLSLAWYLIRSPLKEKKILVVDSDLTSTNNKTWCFWYNGKPPFNDLIYKTWARAQVFIGDEHISGDLNNYPYHCIKSADFRTSILDELQEHGTVDLLESSIQQVVGNEKEPILKTAGKTYSAEYIFQSCFVPPQFKSPKIRYPLIQSFLGFDIETQQSLFDINTFILMDLDDTYEGGLAFMYVLPWSRGNALVEYTIFDEHVQPQTYYQKKIELYLGNKYNLKRIDYQIKRTEYGEIPMKDLPYAPWYQPRVMNLGMSGGLTKPSTGYTFARIQQHVKQIVKELQQSGTPALPHRSPFRYRAYDLWLLQIMHDHPKKTLEIFHDLFANNEISQVFKFLAEDNTLAEDLKIMNSVPYSPFLKAIWETRKRLFEL